MRWQAGPAVPASVADDVELATRVARHDQAAFEMLMRRHNGRLFRVARSILRDDAEAEDALQDAYLDAGDSVVWLNKDPFPHTATSQSFDSKTVSSGRSWKFTPKARGEFAYLCTLHPTMTAMLRVR
jgi:hypothetical protein